MTGLVPNGPPAILVVDDEPQIVGALKRELDPLHCEVDTYTNPVHAFDAFTVRRHGIVVSDQGMPEMSGIDLLSKVKTLSPFTVRILLTGTSDAELAVRAINDGGIHRFIAKPWTRQGLLEHLTIALDRYRDLYQREMLIQELTSQNSELVGLNQSLKDFAQRDRLTGLFNRGEFDLQLERQVACHRRDQQPFCLVLGDIDNFKRINDTFGHLTGDDVIRAAADVLQRSVRREVDTAFRYGGEEFAVLLRNTNAYQSKAPAARILHGIRAASVPAESQPLSFTMSFGIAQYNNGEPVRTLIRRVDTLLYLAKSSGKNCVRWESD